MDFKTFGILMDHDIIILHWFVMLCNSEKKPYRKTHYSEQHISQSWYIQHSKNKLFKYKMCI